MFYVQPYVCPPVVNTIMSILRNGSIINEKFYANHADTVRLFQPMNQFVVREDLLKILKGAHEGLPAAFIEIGGWFSQSPSSYPEKFDSWVTSDHLEKKIWMRLPREKPSGWRFFCLPLEAKQVDPVNSNADRHSATVPIQYPDGQSWRVVFDWSPTEVRECAIARTTEGHVLRDDVYDILSGDFDNPFWLVHDLSADMNVFPRF